MMKSKKLLADRKYTIKKRTPFSHDLLPVIESLMAEGRSIADIGMMLGYAGKDPKQWVNYLKKTHPEVKDALDAGSKMADCKLVTTAFDVACGYDVEETTVDYKAIPEPEEKGKKRKYKYIEEKRKVKTVHVQPKESLLFRLLCNRLPEYFSDTKHVEVDKRSIDVRATYTNEIEGLAGKLMDVAKKRKTVEAEVVETGA
jgi:hypothetical protein